MAVRNPAQTKPVSPLAKASLIRAAWASGVAYCEGLKGGLVGYLKDFDLGRSIWVAKDRLWSSVPKSLPVESGKGKIRTNFGEALKCYACVANPAGRAFTVRLCLSMLCRPAPRNGHARAFRVYSHS